MKGECAGAGLPAAAALPIAAAATTWCRVVQSTEVIRRSALPAMCCASSPDAAVARRLTWSEMFESFLANKYTAAKR